MEEFTIYCTEEQTKKALELGASIEKLYSLEELRNNNHCYPRIADNAYAIPTAEQMIGWLEKQLGEYSSVYVVQDSQGWWSAHVYDSCNYRVFYNNDYHSRKEATFAAIDAALNYLAQKDLIK